METKFVIVYSPGVRHHWTDQSPLMYDVKDEDMFLANFHTLMNMHWDNPGKLMAFRRVARPNPKTGAAEFHNEWMADLDGVDVFNTWATRMAPPMPGKAYPVKTKWQESTMLHKGQPLMGFFSSEERYGEYIITDTAGNHDAAWFDRQHQCWLV